MSVEKDYFEGRSVEITDLNKDERSRLRPIVGATLLASVLGALILYLAFYPRSVKAEETKPAPVYVAHIGSNRLSLFQDACALGDWFATWKKAQWFYQGRNFDACWKIQRDADDLYVYTVDANGDAGSIPLAMFHKDEDV